MNLGSLSPTFDWYSCSLTGLSHGAIDAVLNGLRTGLSVPFPHDLHHQPDRGIPQYNQCTAFYDGPDRVCDLSYDGNKGASPVFRARGWSADVVVPIIREMFPLHRVSRLDSCVDMVAEDLFDQIYGQMQRIHDEKGIHRRSYGFAAPENGRTFYLGSAKSPVQVRLYEKGKKAIGEGKDADPNWVRLEVQVKPLTRDKAKYANVSSIDAWGASRWSRDLFSLVTNMLPTQIRQERLPDVGLRERGMRMSNQYRKTVQELLEVLSNRELGDFIAFHAGNHVPAATMLAINAKLDAAKFSPRQNAA